MSLTTTQPRPETRAATRPSLLDAADARPLDVAIYLAMGTLFGVLLVKSEVVSWYRIQEMFRFDSFHMYGIIGSAIAVAAVSLAALRRAGATTIRGEALSIRPKPFDRGVRQLVGGTIFGFGWALLGACPGPIYALIGAGVTPVVVGLAAAVAGAWAYGHLAPKLPH
jgi:hypothetical protein